MHPAYDAEVLAGHESRLTEKLQRGANRGVLERSDEPSMNSVDSSSSCSTQQEVAGGVVGSQGLLLSGQITRRGLTPIDGAQLLGR